MRPVSILTPSAYSWALGILNSCRSWQDSPRYRHTFCTQNTIAQASSHKGTEDTCSPTFRDALAQLPGLPSSRPTSQNKGSQLGWASTDEASERNQKQRCTPQAGKHALLLGFKASCNEALGGTERPMQTTYNPAQPGPLLEEVLLTVVSLLEASNLPNDHLGDKSQGTGLTQEENQASNACPAAFPGKL